MGTRRPESMLKEIAASLVRMLSGSSIGRPVQAFLNPLESDLDPLLGQERPGWTAQGAVPVGAGVLPSLPSLGGQRPQAGFPGAGTHAGDHVLATPEIGSDRPSTLLSSKDCPSMTPP